MCKGGAGGRGNAKNKYIKTFETGKEGETKDILLELKSISDVGLVGFPNVNYLFLIIGWKKHFFG